MPNMPTAGKFTVTSLGFWQILTVHVTSINSHQDRYDLPVPELMERNNYEGSIFQNMFCYSYA